MIAQKFLTLKPSEPHFLDKKPEKIWWDDERRETDRRKSLSRGGADEKYEQSTGQCIIRYTELYASCSAIHGALINSVRKSLTLRTALLLAYWFIMDTQSNTLLYVIETGYKQITFFWQYKPEILFTYYTERSFTS